MALVLDDTVGGEDSNTYISLTDADTYFESRLDSTNWDAATDAVKDESLAMATRMLDDMYNFIGCIASNAQALRWPRTRVYDRDGRYLPSDENPTQVKNATCEQALYLLSGDVTTTPVLLTQGFKKAKVGPLMVEADLSFTPSQMSSTTTFALAGLGTLASSVINLHRA